MKTISPEKAEAIGYGVRRLDRRVHIRCMHSAGQRGIADMSMFSTKYVEPPADKTSLSALDISPDHDIIGFDHPRKDIVVRTPKSGKAIRIGGNTFSDRSTLAFAAEELLNKNFTREEVRKMNLYFEANPISVPGVAGTHILYRSEGRKPISTIAVSANDLTEALVTHELVHALRAADGRRNTDIDSEEIETEYETTLRLQEPAKARGYYMFVPGVHDGHGGYNLPKMVDAALSDRVLATGTTDKPLKGRRLTHDVVPNTVKYSRIDTARSVFDDEGLVGHSIGEAQPLIAEDVDTYFQIKLPDRTKADYHIRFVKARPPLKEIKKHLKEKFGKNIDAWEWRDGRKVQLISRPKKTRSRKRTAKKSVSAKKKTSTRKRAPTRKRTTRKSTPARKLVAAEPYGLDAILGVPEGFL